MFFCTIFPLGGSIRLSKERTFSLVHFLGLRPPQLITHSVAESLGCVASFPVGKIPVTRETQDYSLAVQLLPGSQAAAPRQVWKEKPKQASVVGTENGEGIPKLSSILLNLMITSC